MKLSLFLLFALFSFPSHGAVQVAFIESRYFDQTNAKEDRFFHLAISFEDQWLHTHPYRGVELVSKEELEKMGPIAVILEVQDHSQPTKEFVQGILGRPFDWTFSWTGTNYYCSKLVGKWLDLSPRPMSFSSAHWPDKFKKLKGNLGLSPDEVYRQLIDGRYKVNVVNLRNQCSQVFAKPVLQVR